MTFSADAIEFLTSQFGDADETKELLAALLTGFDELDTGLDYLLTYTNLDNAAGVWLDNEAAIVGTKRRLAEIDEDNIFTFTTGETDTSLTQGFDGGYLRSLNGNYIPGTLMNDEELRAYTIAKATATFKGTSLRDIVDFVYNSYGVECRADFIDNSDVLITLQSHLPYSSKRIIEQYAPVSAGSTVYATE